MNKQQRNPRVDPVDGDVLQSPNETLYVVLHAANSVVRYLRIHSPADVFLGLALLENWRLVSKDDKVIAYGGLND